MLRFLKEIVVTDTLCWQLCDTASAENKTRRRGEFENTFNSYDLNRLRQDAGRIKYIFCLNLCRLVANVKIINPLFCF